MKGYSQTYHQEVIDRLVAAGIPAEMPKEDSKEPHLDIHVYVSNSTEAERCGDIISQSFPEYPFKKSFKNGTRLYEVPVPGEPFPEVHGLIAITVKKN